MKILYLYLFAFLFVSCKSTDSVDKKIIFSPVFKYYQRQEEHNEYTLMTPEQLIDELINLDKNYKKALVKEISVGINGPDIFHAVETNPYSPVRKNIPPLRELTRRGVAVLPVLIKHLNDNREIILVDRPFSLQYQYDPKDNRKRASFSHIQDYDFFKKGGYKLTVGDVCYKIIGSIVNRRFYPITIYGTIIPTGTIGINSPIKNPKLMQKVKEDWGGITEDEYKNSLLGDLEYIKFLKKAGIRSSKIAITALGAYKRIVFYYPELLQSEDPEYIKEIEKGLIDLRQIKYVKE